MTLRYFQWESTPNLRAFLAWAVRQPAEPERLDLIEKIRAEIALRDTEELAAATGSHQQSFLPPAETLR